ncbi:unnamed protein product [Peniophora sp. CBMAI 1063]|nr:unnamed protein product [Peniophora sp. CBMAI 1063]
MSEQTTVFLTGATGYLGGATLQLLLHNPKLSITVLVRDNEKAEKLKQLGLKVVLGSLDDTELMEAEGAKADVILQNAAYDHINGVNALLRGAKAYYERTGKQSIFIQTSGTGAFVKMDAMGDYTSETVLSDTEPDLYRHKNTLAHSVVNEALIAADSEGFVRSYIVLPSIVYGVLKGPLVDAGITHAYSMAMTWAAKLSIERGQGAQVGKGLNRWPAVHIDDTADFYKLVFERALAGDAPHGAQGNYVLENGEFSFGEAAKRYTATPFIYFLGTDVRIRGDRSRQLGWSPAHGIEDFYESVQEDTEAVLAGKD